jgi:hypothetical protein
LRVLSYRKWRRRVENGHLDDHQSNFDDLRVHALENVGTPRGHIIHKSGRVYSHSAEDEVLSWVIMLLHMSVAHQMHFAPFQKSIRRLGRSTIEAIHMRHSRRAHKDERVD